MKWNWQQDNWTKFEYQHDLLQSYEDKFLLGNGVIFGAKKHLNSEEEHKLRIELISLEALKTSEIEGEYLDRDSVQSSIQYHFGFTDKLPKTGEQEKGISQMMVNLYQSFAEPLKHDMLFDWHTLLMQGTDIKDIGSYRTNPDDEPMQVVSGAIYKPKVHFQAPPSKNLQSEMTTFISWFNNSLELSPLVRAGIAHLYFVCIHPFSDGNGRITRALSEKVLSQAIGEPSLIALAYTIQKNRKAYYDHLEKANKSNEITEWLLWFAEIVLEAQENTLARIEFIIDKTKLYDRLRGQLNERQAKALERMFREGVEGFTGGLSASNYMKITKAPPTTATRDLTDLVNKKALTRTGERKHTRYFLNLK